MDLVRIMESNLFVYQKKRLVVNFGINKSLTFFKRFERTQRLIPTIKKKMRLKKTAVQIQSRSKLDIFGNWTSKQISCVENILSTNAILHYRLFGYQHWLRLNVDAISLSLNCKLRLSSYIKIGQKPIQLN